VLASNGSAASAATAQRVYLVTMVLHYLSLTMMETF
jgi:hypothetical protein